MLDGKLDEKKDARASFSRSASDPWYWDTIACFESLSVQSWIVLCVSRLTQNDRPNNHDERARRERDIT
eukprot:scaffold768_cov166-Amphora_coffeaeformis.AAC.29